MDVSESGSLAIGEGAFGTEVSFANVQRGPKAEHQNTNRSIVDEINALFPTEQSLSQLDSVIQRIDNEISSIDNQITELVETHASVGSEGEAALDEAHKAMADLEQRVSSIRLKTQSSETVVEELTRDIKQLDVAKRNLTASIKALHHIHILLNGVSSLQTWTEQRQYADIASQLPVVLNVLLLFQPYMEVEQVKNIAEQVNRLKQRLAVQIIADLKHSFLAGSLNASVTNMCRVASTLDVRVQDEFLCWFVDHQLSEYTVIFGESEDIAWLDKIDMRYGWFVFKLTDFEKSGMSKVFPCDWDMGRKLTMEYCKMTKKMLEKIMTKRRAELDFKLLAHGINHTLMFENLLCKRFPSKDGYNFDKIIWCAFDNFMDVFVAAQQKNLNQFLEECVARIRSGAERPARETAPHAHPLPSSADMFLLLKNIIAESTKLASNPHALLSDLVDVLRSCLRGYGHGCLTAFLPSLSSAHSSSTSILQTFMRDECIVRLTTDQQFFTCCILATADWCGETTLQLQEKLKQRVQTIDLNQEMELFYSISNSALSVLVQDVESACDAALQTVSKINWNGVESVGDESPYVTSIRNHLRMNVPLFRDFFADRRKYFAHFCLKLATQIVNKFLGVLFRCRQISVSGAEQLLLDTHALKTFLLNMPSVDSSISLKPPTIYTNVVAKTMTRAEMILKLIMSETENAVDFITIFSRLLPDSDLSELQKILEMKALRRQEQANIIQMFRLKIEGQNSEQNASSQQSTLSTLESLGDSSMRRLEQLVRKF